MRRCQRILVVSALFAVSAFSQRDLGTIVGVISDPSGGVVTNAHVTITEDSTGQKYSTVTDSTGTFIRPLLKPGNYSVEAEAPGFKKAIQRNVLVTAGDRVQANLPMQVGEITQAVEVQGSAPALQTESTIIGQTIQGQQMSELPLSGQRKFSFLARIAPGVLPAEPGARDAAGGGFSANGVRSNGQNNFLLNGVDNNVNVIDFINQTAYVVGPSVEAIGEMKVLTNGYNAEYGRGAGGVVNVTIKSGTNQVNGVLFEFLQNKLLDGNKWENNRAGVQRGAFQQNQFGAAVGGPLIRNKTFWFADYQGTRIRSTGGAVPGLGNTFTRTIPFPEFKNGDFSRLLTGRVLGQDALGRDVPEGGIFDITTTRTVNNQLVRDWFPGNRIPVSRFDPIAKRLIDLYPNPNQNLGDRIPGNNYIVVTSGRQQNDQGDVRIDHRLTEKDSIFGTLSWSEEDKFQSPPLPGALDAAGFAGVTEKNQARNAMVSWTRVWKPTFLTETRLAFSRLITQRQQANSGTNLFKEFGFGGLDPTTFTDNNGGLPLIQPEGYSDVGGSEWLPTLEYSNVLDFIQNVSINKSAHALKFGFEGRSIKFPFFQVPSPRGTLRFQRPRTQHPQFSAGTGDGIAGWLQGYPGDSRITTANFISTQKQAYAWYLQDDWKLTPKLTLNIGVRYELFSPIDERFGRQSNYDIDRNTLVIPRGKDQDAPLPPNFAAQYPQIAVERALTSSYLIPWDKTDIAPRVGIAWQAVNRTVVRVGYGIFYGGEENHGGDPQRAESVPFNQEVQFNSPNQFALVPTLGRFSDGFPVNSFSLPAAIRFRSIATNFRNPLVHKWNFAIQREIVNDTTLELTYIGSKGTRQLVLFNYNQPLNVADPNADRNARRRIPFIAGDLTQAATFGQSFYNGFIARLERRQRAGWSYVLSYTFGHALADTGTTLSGSPGFGFRDITRISAEYASAAWDIRHRFVYSTNYDLPFGRGKRFGAGWNRGLNVVAGNWQINGVLTLSTGPPFTLGTRNYSCGCGNTGSGVRPDLVPGKNPQNAPAGGRTPDRYFDTSAVTDPARGTFGNIGNNTNYGPGLRNVDLSLFKDFRLTERFRFQFRAEAFNLSNTPQFDVGTINRTQGETSFGRIAGTLSGTERHVQFALRLMF